MTNVVLLADKRVGPRTVTSLDTGFNQFTWQIYWTFTFWAKLDIDTTPLGYKNYIIETITLYLIYLEMIKLTF